ncbi:MAG: glutamate synthase subunit alpha, partial [Lachnospiraceae bacterium]
FMGKPEYVENFMRFIARQLWEYMAKLGVCSIEEMVGRRDLLKKKEGLTGQAAKVDLSCILEAGVEADRAKTVFHPDKVYDFALEQTKDEAILLSHKEVQKSIQKGKKTKLKVSLTNIDRTFGTLVGAEITRQHPEGLEEDTLTVSCKGAGGQSFGAFIPAGLTLTLSGDSNDYFGKGLSGGKLAVSPPDEAGYEPEENIIIGNVALYGATKGEAYIAGMAGERFGIRNSGATAVVEGVGEHGLEYMTGGKVVVLGPTGKNFAAGMSGGIAYVLDEENCLYRNLNKEMVLMEKVEAPFDKETLRKLLENHVAYTGSKKAAKVLEQFDEYLPKFKKIIPEDYKRMLQLSSQFEEQGMSGEQAQIEAFYASVSDKGVE